MKRILRKTLPLLLLVVLMGVGSTTIHAKTMKKMRTVYYIVCGSYTSLNAAIKQSEAMSEVVFYPVYKTKVNGKTVYRLCCECYYSREDAQKDLDGILSGFKGDDWWIWPSKGLAKCVYRPQSPADGESRIPALKPRTKALTE
jgi:hypothetical protein